MLGFDEPNHAIVLGRDLPTLYGQGATTPELISTYASLGVKFETWDQAGLPQSLIYSNKLNLGPRLGSPTARLKGRAVLWCVAATACLTSKTRSPTGTTAI